MAASENPPNYSPEFLGDRSEAELFVNRELSFLEFNQRVVDEAADPKVPLLERLKFIAIVSTNLDEFFMVRVAGLKQQLKSGVLEAGPDRMLPAEQLSAISARVAAQIGEQERILLEEIIPALDEQGVQILRVSKLASSAQRILKAHFEEQVFPMLTPLAVDPGHPFPFLKNRTLNLAVHLLPEQAAEGSMPLLSVVQVPMLIPRFVDVPTDRDLSVVFLEDLITRHVGMLYPGMKILECVPFRVIRNWDLSFDEDEQDDLLDTVQKELRRRWRLDAVRLNVGEGASEHLISRLGEALALTTADVQTHSGPLALGDLNVLWERVGRSDMRDALFQPVLSPVFQESDNIFSVLAEGDVLLHHPYESYEPVLDLLGQAAQDPQVLAIKQTLYRVNRHSPILESLISAAENGKQVTALVELKARFDEEVNVEWALALEKAGVHVVYGMIGLKTHCKVTLVVRREVGGIKRYVHLGTGNYNEKTATIYCDLSYFTCRPDVGEDMSALFNLLTGYSEPPTWQKLVMAPLGLRRHILERISEASLAAKSGESAKIIIKSNAIIDAQIIRALCRASQNGVEVILLVRGPCTLRVGLPQISDRIKVRVVVDRFLEHSRVLYFSHGSTEHVFITSTDIMPRNFDRRLEVMLPVEDERLKRRLVDEILGIELADNVKAAVLTPQGTYQRVASSTSTPVRSQSEFIALARRRQAEAADTRGPRRRERRRPDEA